MFSQHTPTWHKRKCTVNMFNRNDGCIFKLGSLNTPGPLSVFTVVCCLHTHTHTLSLLEMLRFSGEETNNHFLPPPADHYGEYQFKALWMQLRVSEPGSVIFFQLHRLQMFYTECVWHLNLAWTQTQFFSLMCTYRDTVWKFCLLTFACNFSQSHSDEESCQKSLKPDSDTENVHV